MAYKPSVLEIAAGGSNASSFTQSNGVVAYNGTSLVNYAGPQIDSSGRQTNTSQPAFSGELSSGDINVTGNGTVFTIGSGNAFTEIFDQGNNFVTTGTFTAPLTGKYFLEFSLKFLQSTGATTCAFLLITSNRNYSKSGTILSTASQLYGNSWLCDMDSGDTATYTVSLTGIGADTADVQATSTIVNGYLVC